MISVYYDLTLNCSLIQEKKMKIYVLVSDKTHFRQVSMGCNKMTPEGEFILTFEGNRLSQIIEVRLRWIIKTWNQLSV